MNDYRREYPLFSLCGLNCGLCPRYHTDGASRCPGCGGEGFSKKHPTCGVISCSLRHGGVQYCFLCAEYPCEKLAKADRTDSFITHRNMQADFARAGSGGMEAYRQELEKKVSLLQELLAQYNDGRRKSFFCLAVNLLPLADVQAVMKQLAADLPPGGKPDDAVARKKKAAQAVALFQARAEQRGIPLVLNKKGSPEKGKNPV